MIRYNPNNLYTTIPNVFGQNKIVDKDTSFPRVVSWRWEGGVISLIYVVYLLLSSHTKTDFSMMTHLKYYYNKYMYFNKLYYKPI